MAQLKDTIIDGNLEVNGFLDINTINSMDTIESTDSVLINGGGVINQTPVSNLKPDDTGWIDISPEIGTWKLLKYRRVGDLVNVKGHCNSLTFAGGSAIKLATLPEDIRPTMTNEYLIAPAGGKKLVRVGLNTKGNIFLDYIINISDASNYTGDTWIFFNFVYFIL